MCAKDGRIIVWEMILAQVIYRILAPAVRFAICIFISDAWQYFGHRAFHENRWLYRMYHNSISQQPFPITNPFRITRKYSLLTPPCQRALCSRRILQYSHRIIYHGYLRNQHRVLLFRTSYA